MSTTEPTYPRRGSLHTYSSPSTTGAHEGHTVEFLSHTTKPDIVKVRCTHDHEEAHTFLSFLTPIPGDPRLMPTTRLPIGCRVKATTLGGETHFGTVTAPHLLGPFQYTIALDRNAQHPNHGKNMTWDPHLIEPVSDDPAIPGYQPSLTPDHYPHLVGTRVSVGIPGGPGPTSHYLGTVVPPEKPTDSPTCCYVLLDKKLSRPNPFGFFHEHIESLVGPDLFDLTPLDHTLITVSLRLPTRDLADWDPADTVQTLDLLFEHHDALTLSIERS